MKAPEWAVATIAREKPETIRRFVAWHLAAGASEITIYFDDPEDPSISLVAHLPQVKAVRCTPEFWTSIGSGQGRPFVKRQNAAMQTAYRACSKPWILICDADELLYVRPPRSVGQILSAQPDDVISVKFGTAERVAVTGRETESMFRLPAARRLLRDAHAPEIAGALVRTRGLIGHSQGKSIHRTGIADLYVRQHDAFSEGGKRVTKADVSWKTGGALLHLMNVNFEDWYRKLSFRIGGWSIGQGLQRVLKRAFEDGNPETARQVFDALYTFSPEIGQLYQKRGKLVTLAQHPDHAVESYFPDVPAAQ